jgi:hypothetical protein
MALTAPVDEAQRAVNRERRRCVDEREAFRSFRSAVSDVQPTAVPGGQTGPLATQRLGATRTRASELESVRQTYERTVMDVPHYEAEYDDGYVESLSAEFGEDIAAAVTSATAFTPELRRAVVGGARAAMEERVEFIALLDEESSSLEAVEVGIQDVVDEIDRLDDRPLPSRSFDELVSLRTAVADLRPRLDDLATARQRTLASHRRELSGRVPDVTAYLYADCPRQYPALGALADARAVLERALRRVDRLLAATP